MIKLKNKIQLLALSSSAQSGKDTLYLILQKILKEYNITTDRIGLGDIVKIELNDFTKEKYGISAFTSNLQEKELIRPLMVSHGLVRRKLTNGKYFTDKILYRLLENKNNNILSIVTDCRYIKYPEDEISFIKSNGGLIIYIERILSDGRIVEPANSEEAENNPKIKKISDFQLKWPTTEDENIREDCVKLQLKDLIYNIINSYK